MLLNNSCSTDKRLSKRVTSQSLNMQGKVVLDVFQSSCSYIQEDKNQENKAKSKERAPKFVTSRQRLAFFCTKSTTKTDWRMRSPFSHDVRDILADLLMTFLDVRNSNESRRSISDDRMLL